MPVVGELFRMARFGVVGLLNTALGLSVVYLCKWFGMDDIPANLTGYAAGLLNSFVWNRAWTFGDSVAPLQSAGRFAVAFVIAYLANLATVVALLRGGADAHLAHAIGVVPYTVFLYVGCRWFVFVRVEP